MIDDMPQPGDDDPEIGNAQVDPIREAAKVLADEPPDAVPGAEGLPDDVRDGEVD